MKPGTWYAAGRVSLQQFMHLCMIRWCLLGKTCLLLVLGLLISNHAQAFHVSANTESLNSEVHFQDMLAALCQVDLRGGGILENKIQYLASNLWAGTVAATISKNTGSILLAPLDLTNRFYGFCAIAMFLLLVLGLVYLKTRRMMFMQKKLEQIVSERTKEILAQKQEIERQRDNIEQKHLQLLQARQIIVKQNKELKESNTRLIKEVKDRTRDLRHANKDLMLTSQELDELIYKASHDIRGPLARMIGICNLAMLDLGDPQAKEYLTLLRKEAVNTTEILAKLLSISHLKKTAINTDSIGLANIVRQCIYSLEHLENFHFINFHLQVPEYLSLKTDSGLLKIILSNLLENAALYADNIKPEIHVFASVLDEKVVISVKDNGAGIPDEIAARIFERYFRGTEKSKGAGLGLYTASSAAKKLQGTVQLRQSTGSETEFIIELPIAVLDNKLAQLVA